MIPLEQLYMHEFHISWFWCWDLCNILLPGLHYFHWKFYFIIKVRKLCASDSHTVPYEQLNQTKPSSDFDPVKTQKQIQVKTEQYQGIFYHLSSLQIQIEMFVFLFFSLNSINIFRIYSVKKAIGQACPAPALP